MVLVVVGLALVAFSASCRGGDLCEGKCGLMERCCETVQAGCGAVPANGPPPVCPAQFGCVAGPFCPEPAARP